MLITMKDIAQKLGVSQPAVSVVLNNKKKSNIHVGDEMRKRILQTAEEMGYRHNRIASSMKTGKTFVVGVVGMLHGGYCMDIINGISSLASRKGYALKTMPTIPHDSLGTENMKGLPITPHISVSEVARTVTERRLDGVICCSLNDAEIDLMRTELEPQEIPMVLLGSKFTQDWCSRIVTDDSGGIEKAVDHLVELGHTKIIPVTRTVKTGFSAIRHAGYLKAMERLGLPEVTEIIDDFTEMSEKDFETISGIIKRHKPTAVVCGSDVVALKFLNVAYRMGLRVPDWLSVVGFGCLEYSGIYTPALTTIKQPFCLMGQTAFEVLLEHIEKKIEPQEKKIKTELVIRGSTATVYRG